MHEIAPLMEVWNAQNMLFLSNHIGNELRQKQRGRNSQTDFGHFIPVLRPALHRRQPDREHRQSEPAEGAASAGHLDAYSWSHLRGQPHLLIETPQAHELAALGVYPSQYHFLYPSAQNYLVESCELSSLQVSFPLNLMLEYNKFGRVQYEDLSPLAKLKCDDKIPDEKFLSKCRIR